MQAQRRHTLDGRVHFVAEHLRSWRTSTTAGRKTARPPLRAAGTARLIDRVRPSLTRRP